MLVALRLHHWGPVLLAAVIAIVVFNTSTNRATTDDASSENSWTGRWVLLSLALVILGHVIIGFGPSAIVPGMERVRVLLPASRVECLFEQLRGLSLQAGSRQAALFLYFTVVTPYLPLVAAIALRPRPMRPDLSPHSATRHWFEDGSWRWRTATLVALGVIGFLFLTSQLRDCAMSDARYEPWMTDFRSAAKTGSFLMHYLIPGAACFLLAALLMSVGNLLAADGAKRSSS